MSQYKFILHLRKTTFDSHALFGHMSVLPLLNTCSTRALYAVTASDHNLTVNTCLTQGPIERVFKKSRFLGILQKPLKNLKSPN